jgi:MFS family permease
MTEASPQRANMGFIGAIVAVATIGGFLFGYDSGAVNGTQDGLTQAFGLVPGSWSPTNGLGFTVASLLIGCFIGAFFAGRLADLMGRRNTMMVAAALFLAGALVQGFSHSQLIFVIARVCGGMAVGAASVLSPAYISEVAPAEIRGRLTTVQQIMIITGLTAAFVVNYFLAKSAGVSTEKFWLGLQAWRWMFLMQALPAAIFLVALLMIPESPRYLVSKGREEQATGVLAKLFGSDIARAKLDEIRSTFSADHRPRLSDVLTPSGGRGFLGVRFIVWVGIMLAVFQQLVGINVIFYYGASAFQCRTSPRLLSAAMICALRSRRRRDRCSARKRSLSSRRSAICSNSKSTSQECHVRSSATDHCGAAQFERACRPRHRSAIRRSRRHPAGQADLDQRLGGSERAADDRLRRRSEDNEGGRGRALAGGIPSACRGRESVHQSDRRFRFRNCR